jgi:hypothetical protein
MQGPFLTLVCPSGGAVLHCAVAQVCQQAQPQRLHSPALCRVELPHRSGGAAAGSRRRHLCSKRPRLRRMGACPYRQHTPAPSSHAWQRTVCHAAAAALRAEHHTGSSGQAPICRPSDPGQPVWNEPCAAGGPQEQ